MGPWTTCGVTTQGQPINVGGVNPWDYSWVSQHRRVMLPHPIYPHQRHDLHIYVIEADGRQITFAAGELSASVWGFYVPACLQAPL